MTYWLADKEKRRLILRTLAIGYGFFGIGVTYQGVSHLRAALDSNLPSLSLQPTEISQEYQLYYGIGIIVIGLTLIASMFFIYRKI